jgi:hypothetical protein
MANPNIANLTDIRGKTNPALLTTSSQTLTENETASNLIYKLNTVILSNKTSDIKTATIGITRDSTFFELAFEIVIPGNSSIVIISKDNGIFLEEGDTLDALASANDSINSFVSYEIITDQTE